MTDIKESEKTDDAPKIEDSIKKTDDKDKKPDTEKKESDKKWDKERQKEEQEQANYRKLQKTFENASNAQLETISQLQQQIAVVAEKLSELGSKKEPEKLPELDPLLVDGNVIKNISALQKTLAQAEKRLADAESKISSYEKNENEKASKTKKDNVVDKILKPLDEEFGAKFRQKAIELADKLINDGDEEQPVDALEASQLMRKCYRKLKDELESKKTPATLDNGKGTIASEKIESKPGKLDDVWEQMRKEGKFKPS